MALVDGPVEQVIEKSGFLALDRGERASDPVTLSDYMSVVVCLADARLFDECFDDVGSDGD